jgi:hypothetical protein
VPDTPAVKKEWDLNNPEPVHNEAVEVPNEDVSTGNRLINENKGEGVAVIMPEMDEEEGGKLFIDELAPTLVID